MLNNLAAAGLAILAWDTNELFMPGFQFSLGVVFTIILLAGWFQRHAAKIGAPDPFLPKNLWSPFQKAAQKCSHEVSKLFGVSTAATIGSLPFAAGYFNLVTPSSILANMAIVPMAFLILGCGILSAIAGIFSNTLCAVFNNVNWLLAHAVLWTVHLFAQAPGGHFYVEMPQLTAKPACEIVALDLGGGAAIHIRSQGRDWLEDCGSGGAYDSIVRNYLHSRGVNRLDSFVASHGSSKFIGAAASLEADFAPALSADSPLDDRSPSRREFHQWLSDHTLARTTLKRGDELDISPMAKIRVLYPPADSDARVADEKALVLRLECAGCRVLLMPGGGAITERWLLDHEPDLRCDILVKSPHTGEMPEFLDAVHPQAIICANSSYAAERIDEAWAGAVDARGIRLFRQDETGAVNVKLDSGAITVKPFLGNEDFTARGQMAK